MESKGDSKKSAKSTTAKKRTAETAEKKEKKVSAKAASPKARAPRERKGGKNCRMEGCKRGYRAKGYCRTHYRLWRQGEYGVARYKSCADFECRKPMAVNRHGFCEDHFQNYYVKGLEQAKEPAAAPAKEEKKESAA